MVLCKFLTILLLINVVSSKNISNEVLENGQAPCKGIDLVFLLDTSRSIWGPDFKKQMAFVENIIDEFKIGPDIHDTRVGAITFAQTFWPQFYLRSYLDKRRVKTAIRYIRHKNGYRTNTAAALKFLYGYMFNERYGGRPHANHVAIIITDGRSQNRESTLEAAKIAREKGIQIFAIGVGKYLDAEELEGIGSQPIGQHVFTVSSYSELGGIKDRLPSNACEVTTTTTTTTTTTPRPSTTKASYDVLVPAAFYKSHYYQYHDQANTNNYHKFFSDKPADYCGKKEADIYFVLDASSSIWKVDFDKELNFVNEMIDDLKIDNVHGRIRAGVVVFSNRTRNVVALDSKRTQAELKRQISGVTYSRGVTNTNEAIRFVRQYGFREGVTRPGAIKIAIVMTDGISRLPRKTMEQSELARNENITIFAIGIGNKVDKTELKRIANDPNSKHVFHVSDFNGLHAIKDLLVLSTCAVIPDVPQNLQTCSGDKETDVLFAYDVSSLGFRKSEVIGRFIHTLVSSLDLSTGKVNVGRITDNCPRYSNVPLGRDTKLFTELKFPGIGQLLKSMNKSFPVSSNVKRIGVLVVDESTTGEREAVEFIKKNNNFELMVIAIGDRQNTAFAADLASDPDFNFLVRVPQYSDLSTSFSRVLDKLCTAIKRSFVLSLNS
ncbi:cartilage matrix protein-like [Saccostrea echinata]|uniref:cartilage matrix protein-like n=1 Tax=Saccostrea echinata TaxID=191078 RepID=UPI002A839A97|nr:cartilage matrix protein-like [Saccostrea echinata]